MLNIKNIYANYVIYNSRRVSTKSCYCCSGRALLYSRTYNDWRTLFHKINININSTVDNKCFIFGIFVEIWCKKLSNLFVTTKLRRKGPKSKFHQKFEQKVLTKSTLPLLLTFSILGFSISENQLKIFFPNLTIQYHL